MSFNLQIPTPNTILGTTNSGHTVLFKNIETGYQFYANSKVDNLDNSIGCHISEMIVDNTNGKWSLLVKITKEDACDLLITYFNTHVYPVFQREMPDLDKSDAFGYFVVMALSSKNPNWNKSNWYKNAIYLIETGKIN